jgi:signal transduction histidine kinase
MNWPAPARITERIVLRVLVLGFALVVLMLSLGGFLAVRSTKAIEDDAAQVGREQLAVARLLNDVQAGQNTMAAILHQLAPGQDSIDREALLRELETADGALSRIATSAMGSPEAAQWRELDQAVRVFSRGVREAVHRGQSLRVTDLAPLFNLHDRVVQTEQRLLELSERRIEETERRIETQSRDLSANARWLLGACLLLSLLCAAITLLFAHTSIRKLEAQASELSRVSWHMLETQESLARRFSHELHDELGQSLAAVKANLTAGSTTDWAARRADCVELVDQSIANVRQLSQLLHPVILDDFGLDAGLRWLSEGFAQRTGIRTEYHSDFSGRLQDPAETHLFRIAQEALTNVARHSGATVVRIDLRRSGERRLQMVVEDNGRGLAQEQGRGLSLGMIGMRARAQEAGGEFRLSAAEGHGVRIEVEVPLPAEKEGTVA